MDIKNKRQVKGAQGNAASEYNTSHWFMRAGSWQYGAECDTAAIEAEKAEQDKRFGVPHEDNFPDPAASNGNADGMLPSPANFSNNPGFMAVSTGDMATSGNPRTVGLPTSEMRRVLRPNQGRQTSGGSTGRPGSVGGRTIGRSASLGSRNAVLPAAGDTDPGQEGGPQIVSSGYSG